MNLTSKAWADCYTWSLSSSWSYSWSYSWSGDFFKKIMIEKKLDQFFTQMNAMTTELYVGILKKF